MKDGWKDVHLILDMSRSRTSTDMLWKDPGNNEASLIFYFESGPWHWHIDLYILIKCSSNATSSSCWRSPLKLLGDTLLWNPLAMSRWVHRGSTQKKTWNRKYFCSQLTQLVFYLDCNFLFGSNIWPAKFENLLTILQSHST